MNILRSKRLNPKAVKYKSSLFTFTGHTLTADWEDLFQLRDELKIFLDKDTLGFYVITKNGVEIPFYHNEVVRGANGDISFDKFRVVPDVAPSEFNDIEVHITNLGD